MKFKGGYSFKRFEGAAEPVLREGPVPETVTLSTNVSGIAFLPVVVPGDSVRAGQTIMKDAAGSALAISSPVNGSVYGIPVGSIDILSNGDNGITPLESHTRSPWLLDKSDLIELFLSSGCALLIDTIPTTTDKCNAVRSIIVNAVYNSPLNQAWNPAVFDNMSLFSDGLKTLKAVFPNAAITIAVNSRSRKALENADITEHASIAVVSDKYPQEHPELLFRDVLGKRRTAPDGTRDMSCAGTGFFDVVQIAEVMTLGKPLTDRILLMAGPGVSNPGWYRIRFGTSVLELRKTLVKTDDRGPWRIIRGGLFDGVSFAGENDSTHMEDTEITVIREGAERELYRFMRPGFTWDSYSHTTAADVLPLLPKRLDSNLHGGVRPCVQCNFCDEVCPVNIYPFLIWKYVQADKTEESFRFRPYDCIGCGLCDYVCPSKISISASVKRAAEAYRDTGRKR